MGGAGVLKGLEKRSIKNIFATKFLCDSLFFANSVLTFADWNIRNITISNGGTMNFRVNNNLNIINGGFDDCLLKLNTTNYELL